MQPYAELTTGTVPGANGDIHDCRDISGNGIGARRAVPAIPRHARLLRSRAHRLIDRVAGCHLRQRRRRRVSGVTPVTVEQMARDAIAFIAGIGLDRVDALGFCIGTFAGQEVALRRPAPS